MTAAGVLTVGVGLLALMFVIGLFVLWAGLIKQSNDDQMRHLDRLSPSAQRSVRRQHWALRHLPLPLIAGYVGSHVLGLGLMAINSSAEGLPLRIFFTPTWIVDQLFALRVPRLSLYFWGIVIALAVLVWGRRKQRRQWTAAVG